MNIKIAQENRNSKKPQVGPATGSIMHTEIFFLVTWGYHIRTQTRCDNLMKGAIKVLLLKLLKSSSH